MSEPLVPGVAVDVPADAVVVIDDARQKVLTHVRTQVEVMWADAAKSDEVVTVVETKPIELCLSVLDRQGDRKLIQIGDAWSTTDKVLAIAARDECLAANADCAPVLEWYDEETRERYAESSAEE